MKKVGWSGSGRLINARRGERKKLCLFCRLKKIWYHLPDIQKLASATSECVQYHEEWQYLHVLNLSRATLKRKKLVSLVIIGTDSYRVSKKPNSYFLHRVERYWIITIDYKIIQIVRALWLAIKPFYMSVCKHGFRSSIISYFIKEM